MENNSNGVNSDQGGSKHEFKSSNELTVYSIRPYHTT